MDNATYILFIMWKSIYGLDTWYHFRLKDSCGCRGEKLSIFLFRYYTGCYVEEKNVFGGGIKMLLVQKLKPEELDTLWKTERSRALKGICTRGDRYISRNIVGHQYRGFFGISLYICCISTTAAVRFLDGVVLMACSMAALSLTLYCKQTDDWPETYPF